MKNIPNYTGFKESVTEGSDYDKYATKMYGKKWDDLDRDKQSEVVDAVEGNYPLSKIKRVKESVNEAMAYKKAQKFTKKLNDNALLKDLIYVANKIHDKMGTNDDVQEWLKTVITYGNEHPQQWSESLDEAAPKMTVDPDAEYVSDVISRLGVIGRNATGSNVQKDITKALKVLQNLRSSIQVGR